MKKILSSKTTKLIFRVITLGIIGIIVGTSIYNINAKTILGDQMPMPFGYASSIVLSGSMEPELYAGDLIIVKKTEDLYVDQVIVYQKNNTLVVHRIIAINGDEVITKGDANNVEDDAITKDMIKGEVIDVIPNVGEFVLFIRNPIVTICLIGLMLLGLEYSNRKTKEKDKKEIDKIKEEIDNIKTSNKE